MTSLEYGKIVSQSGRFHTVLLGYKELLNHLLLNSASNIPLQNSSPHVNHVVWNMLLLEIILQWCGWWPYFLKISCHYMKIEDAVEIPWFCQLQCICWHLVVIYITYFIRDCSCSLYNPSIHYKKIISIICI